MEGRKGTPEHREWVALWFYPTSLIAPGSGKHMAFIFLQGHSLIGRVS